MDVIVADPLVIVTLTGLLLLWLLSVLWAAPSGAFVAGKNSRVSANGTNLTMADWTGTYKADDLPVTNFESNGFMESILGILSFDWHIAGTWNANQNPAGNPPTLYPTDSGLNLNFFNNKSSSTANYQLPNYVCTQGVAHPTATGLVAFDSSGHSQGSFTVQ